MNLRPSKKQSTTLLILALMFLPRAAAQIVITGAPSTTGGTLTIVQDLVFTITADDPSDIRAIVFDEMAETSDGNLTQVSLFQPATSNSALTLVRNDGSIEELAPTVLYDNYHFTFRDLTPADVAIFFGSGSDYSVIKGDTITIKSQSWDIESDEEFNMNILGSFSGHAFLVNAAGYQVSSSLMLSAVPEPSSYGVVMGAMALLGTTLRRRRQRVV